MTRPDDAGLDQGHVEQAPMLRAWGPLAGRVAALVGKHPPLLRRVVFAPRRAIHAYAAFLHHAASDMTPAEVAAHLDATHPRTLLKQALPDAARLYPALDRAGERVHAAESYTLFARAANGPFASEFLASQALNPTVATFYDLLAQLHPAVSRFRHALSRDPAKAQALDQLLTLLEGENLLDLADPLSLQAERQPRALPKLLHHWLGGLQAPAVGLDPPDGMHWVEDVGEVRALGFRLDNCLRRFGTSWDDEWLGFLTGTQVYLAGDNPPVAVQLTRAGTFWWVEQVRGSRNAAMPLPVHERLQKWARTKDLVLLRSSPYHLMMILTDGGSADQDLPVVDPPTMTITDIVARVLADEV